MVTPRAASGASVAALVSLLLSLAGSGCRSSKTDRGEPQRDEADASSVPDGGDDDDGRVGQARGAALADASHRFLDASPKVELDLDGPVDPVCSGREVAFATVVVDPRCAIGSARAKALRGALERDGGTPLALRQEASVELDGRIRVRLVNTSEVPLTLPLSWSANLPSFSVLAEDERHSIFELAPPRFEVATRGAEREQGGAGGPDASVAAGRRAHFARIVLPPGGAAVAVVAVDGAITKVLRCVADAGAERCSDGGVCGPSRLVRGRHVLHVGELLTDVEAGPPARVTWDAP